MEFKKQRGGWRDTEQLGYRITKTKTNGIPKRYYACVRTVDKRWEFAWHRRGYKTFKKAVEACEFNRKIWSALIALSDASGNRKSRLDSLDRRGRKGGGNVLLFTALWARSKADPKLLRMLSPYTKVASREEEDECTNDPDDAGQTSLSTESGSSSSAATSSASTTEPTPAPAVKAVEPSSTRPRSASTKPARSTSSVGSAKGSKPAAKRTTAKSTAKRPPTSKRKPKSTPAN